MSETEKLRRSAFKRNRKRWILIQTVIVAILTLAVVASAVAYNRIDQTYYINYTEDANVDYKVYLKDNSFYEEEYLGAGQSYVSSLIDKVVADLKYELDIKADGMEYEYSYKIDTVMTIKDKNVTVLEKVYPVKPLQTFTESENKVVITEQATIDYTQYNGFASKFFEDLNLTSSKYDSTLSLVMTVNVKGASAELAEDTANTYRLSLDMPLVLSTMEIEMQSTVPTGESKVVASTDAIDTTVFMDVVKFGGIADVVLILILIAFIFLTRNDDINYDIKVRKILRNYRSFIQIITRDFNSDGYQVVGVTRFDEMLGIRDTVMSPILMFENDDQTMTRFYIPASASLLYMFEIKVDNFDELYGIGDEEEGIPIPTEPDEPDPTDPAPIPTEEVVEESAEETAPEVVETVESAEAPVEEAPIDEAPAEEAPVEEEPAEEPAEETPVEEELAPVEESAAADPVPEIVEPVSEEIAPVAVEDPVVDDATAVSEPIPEEKAEAPIQGVPTAPSAPEAESEPESASAPVEESASAPVEEPAEASAPAEPENKDAVRFIPELVELGGDDDDDSEDGPTAIAYVGEGGNLINIRCSRSFIANLIQSGSAVKENYSELKNYILSFKGVKDRASWRVESYKKGRIQLFKIKIRGKTICLYCALNPDEFDESRYYHERTDAKVYENVPMLVRIRSDRGLKRAKELVDAVMNRFEIAPNPKAKPVDYREAYPYETTRDLVAKGMIKLMNEDGTPMVIPGLTPNEESAPASAKGTDEVKIIDPTADKAEIDAAMATVIPSLDELDYTNCEIVETADGVEIIGVVIPEKPSGNTVYPYDPSGEKVEKGDVVLVPAHDEAKGKDVVKKGAVAYGNRKVDPATVSPLKKVIGIVKRKLEDALTPKFDEDKK